MPTIRRLKPEERERYNQEGRGCGDSLQAGVVPEKVNACREPIVYWYYPGLIARVVGHPLCAKHVHKSGIELDEIEDFEDAVGRSDKRVEDFELDYQQEALPKSAGPLPAGAHQGTVTVRYEPSGKQRPYPSGHFTSWTAAFDEEFKAGLFD